MTIRAAMFSALLLVFSVGCGRDLSSPSTRLLGHWKTVSHTPEMHYYFSADRMCAARLNALDELEQTSDDAYTVKEVDESKFTITRNVPPLGESDAVFAIAKNGKKGVFFGGRESCLR